MITIATNNGMEYLPRLLRSLKKYGTAGHNILIVDTGSTDKEFREYLSKLPKDMVDRIDGGRDTGAYFHTYKLYPNEKDYMFMHDSMEVTDKDWLKRFTGKKKDFVAFAKFLVAENKCPIPDRIAKLTPFGVGEYGVMGPIFYATNKFMKDVKKAGCMKMIPLDREETHATERLWGGIVEGLGYDIVSANGIFNHEASKSYPSLRKFYPIRP